MKNKALAILLSFSVAVALWAYVITVVSPESEKTYYDIAVEIPNKDILSERGLMIVSAEPKVNLALKSTRTILKSLNKDNIRVTTSVANIEKPGTYELTYDIEYPGNIPSNEISSQRGSTDLITVKVENKIKKTVPVVIDNDDTTVPEGYMVDLKNISLDFEGIEISGPESVMTQIEQAVIHVNLKDQTKTIAGEYTFELCDKLGAKVNVEKVTVLNAEKINLMLPIQRVKEIALKLDIKVGGGVTESAVTMDPMTIQVSGSDTILENLNELVVGSVNLAEVMEDQTLTFNIADVLPENVTNLTGVDEVTVTIKLPKLETKTLNVKTISVINVPESLKAELITKALTVTVRGPKDKISAITADKVSVVVDLSGTTAGTAGVLATVVIAEDFADVGAIGTYQVSVKLREK